MAFSGTKRTLLTAVVISGIFLTNTCWPQAGVAPQGTIQTRPSVSEPVSLNHLYWHFLVYQYRLDQLAVEHEKEGQDGNWLRSYLQTRLSMTALEFEPIREAANNLNTNMIPLKAREKALVGQFRTTRAQGSATAASWRETREALKALSEQRETTIDEQVQALNQALTPSAAQALKVYLDTTFRKNVTIIAATSSQGQQPVFNPHARGLGTQK